MSNQQKENGSFLKKTPEPVMYKNIDILSSEEEEELDPVAKTARAIKNAEESATANNNSNKSNNVWQVSGDSYFPSSSAQNKKLLEPGIYSFNSSPQEWWLTKTATKYIFPYKIYNTHESIENRVKKAWARLPSSVGILLNGLKGTGKTITSQRIVNWAIENNIAVLNVTSPIPLAEILDRVEQPMLVMFDEFEKTHDENIHAGCQQRLLSVLDGLSKSEHKRMFLITTNDKTINKNMIDRPSRIRYCWEFGRLQNDVIEMLLDDMLDKKLQHLRADIIAYLNTREILTMDVVKTAITECNIFEEAPNEFKSFMNLSEMEAAAFKLEIVGQNGQLTTISSYFKMQHGGKNLRTYMSKSGQQMFVDAFTNHGRRYEISSTLGQRIQILGPTDVENEWMCSVTIPKYDTWVKDMPFSLECQQYLWLNKKADDWKPPAWALKEKRGEKLSEEENDEKYNFVNSYLVYTSNNDEDDNDGSSFAVVRVRFSDEEQRKYNHNTHWDAY